MNSVIKAAVIGAVATLGPSVALAQVARLDTTGEWQCGPNVRDRGVRSMATAR